MRKPVRILLVAGLTAGVVVAIQLTVLARAGGGNNYVPPPSTQGGSGSSTGSGSYSSGSGSSHYYSGSGSSGGTSIDLGPSGLFIILGIVGLVLVYRWWQSQQSSSGSNTPVVVAAPMPIDPETIRDGLNAISVRDPNFNPQVFLDRAQTTFFALQNAWMQRNLEPARIYLSDGIYQRWKLQVDQMLAQHRRNVLENLVIGGCALAQIAGDPSIDSITVRIDASAADYDVDDLGKIVRGDRRPRPFTEYWTFVRSRAARTRSGDGAQITQCPNCGAPISVNESGMCAYCKATVTTGQFGWVLDNITQASEWSAAA
jgi:Tim44-like domain